MPEIYGFPSCVRHLIDRMAHEREPRDKEKNTTSMDRTLDAAGTPLISIVTPTYNRARLLERLFASLKEQSFQDFEWIVIDDGSTDDTRAVVERMARVAPFPVRYFWKTNGGTHTAVNMSYPLAVGELLLVVDSDDRCAPDGLAFMADKWRELSPKYPDLLGIVTSSMTEQGEPIGNAFPVDGYVGHLYEVYDRWRIWGDRWNLQLTKILRQFPAPTREGQRLCPEGLVLNRMSLLYREAFFNRATRIHEFEPDGYTANIDRVRVNSAGLFKLYYDEYLDLHVSMRSRLKAACNLTRCAVHDRSLFESWRKRPFAVLVGSIVGVPLALRDICRNRRAKPSRMDWA